MTGSTSLITVPVMIALGIEAHIAVATNMLALTFMSVGGSLPFIGRGVLSRSRLLPAIALTIIGSGLGIAVAQYPAQGPADHHPCGDDWRCRFLAAEIRTGDGPVTIASMSPDSFS